MHNFSISRALTCGFGLALKSFAAIMLGGLLTQPAHAVPFQQYRSASGCSPAALCEIDFPVVAPNRAVTITNVSCSILIGSQSVEILVARLEIVNASDQVTVRDPILPVLQGRNGLGTWFSVNQQTLLAVSSGFNVRASVSTDIVSNFIMSCKIAGDIRVIS